MISNGSCWSKPPTHMVLSCKQAHVWHVGLDLPTSKLDACRALMSQDEVSRAYLLHFETDRNRFMVGRAALRSILGRYLDVGPKDLVFSYGRFGKPELAFPRHVETLNFNISHSAGIMLVAVTSHSRIGIDLESVSVRLEVEQIADHFFSDHERESLSAVPPDKKKIAFLNCWTRKEAFLKAKGDGLSLALDQFEVTVLPGDTAALLATYFDPSEASSWSLYDISLGPEFVASLAVEARGVILTFWNWTALT